MHTRTSGYKYLLQHKMNFTLYASSLPYKTVDVFLFWLPQVFKYYFDLVNGIHTSGIWS